jgi:hypothetical protein
MNYNNIVVDEHIEGEFEGEKGASRRVSREEITALSSGAW